MLDIVLNSLSGTPPVPRTHRSGSRRDFLRAAHSRGCRCRALLRAEGARGPGRAVPSRTGASGRSRSCSCSSAADLSHHDSFDPKPEAPDDIRGKYGQIDTVVPGLRVSDKLPLMAKVMDKIALVRSGAHNNDHHETATNWVLSGRFGTPFGDYPAIGAVVAHETGFSGTLPPNDPVPRNPSFTWELGKSAFLGGRYESFKAGDPNQANYKVQDLTAETTDAETSRPPRHAPEGR